MIAAQLGRVAVFAAITVIFIAFLTLGAMAANDDAYRPPAEDVYGQGGSDANAPPPATDSYEPYRPLDGSKRNSGGGNGGGDYGAPYPDQPPAGNASREERYEPVAPADQGGPPEESGRGYYTQNEIVRAGHGFFGNVSSGLASAIEWAFQKGGRPNGYILGQDAGGAIVAGLRYGEGRLHTKDAGEHKVFWQGPSVGYDFGGEGSKVMVLVYNMRDPSDIYARFAGVEGAAYVVGGVGVQLQKSGDVTMAPIRAGVGLRLGANVGYLKYTRSPTWNPF